MPKTRYTCIDCGKVSPLKFLSRFKHKKEEYRCPTCARIKHCKELAQDPDFIERLKERMRTTALPKVQMICVDCGKPSSLKRANQFNQPYRCKRCATKNAFEKKRQDPVYLEQQRIKLEQKMKRQRKPAALKVQYTCIDCGKLSTKRIPSAFSQPRESYRCQSCGLKKLHQDPQYKIVAGQIREKMYKTHEWKEAVTNGARKRAQDPKARANAKTAKEILYQNPEFREHLLIAITGQGYWYGHRVLCPENRKNKIYCEKWNKDLWRRIDAAWDYRSAISGVTRFENCKQEHLSRHHVYWQEKACCEWDSDAQGYYAMINLGNCAKPRWYKHYIKGDPNKFVLLTRAEHKLIEGNLKGDKTKLAWIQFFEDLIEKRGLEGKRCYLTKEEYEIYKIEHADTIALYDPPKNRKRKTTHQETLVMD